MSAYRVREACLACVFVTAVAANSPVFACPCDGDVGGGPGGVGCSGEPNGVFNFEDVFVLTSFLQGTFDPYCDGTDPLDRLDVNCDGVIDTGDADTMACLGDSPPEVCCDNFISPDPIPAVSSWGVTILTLLTLTAATLLFRKRHRLVSLALPGCWHSTIEGTATHKDMVTQACAMHPPSIQL